MIRGIYSAGAGMGVEQARLDAFSNNLVNATTNGYKKDRMVQSPFPQLFLVFKQQAASGNFPSRWKRVGRTNQGAAINRAVTDFSPGLLQETGEFYHLALENQHCFFVVSLPTPQEPFRELYTRDGAFTVDGEGYLVTLRGERVLGENGSIYIGEEKFSVTGEGVIQTAGRGVIDRLRLVEFADLTVLNKTGDNSFVSPAGAAVPAANPGVRQGFLEQSNVHVAAEIVNMIAVVRAYEANSRVLQAHNDLLGLAVNQVGSLK